MISPDKLFSREALDKMRSPEKLDTLLHITTPVAWIGLSAIVLLLLGYIPIVIERVAWKKDREHAIIKHAVAIGSAIFYTFTVFTAQNLLVVYFAIPMILVISVYNDTRYSLMVNSGVVIESFIYGYHRRPERKVRLYQCRPCDTSDCDTYFGCNLFVHDFPHIER